MSGSLCPGVYVRGLLVYVGFSPGRLMSEGLMTGWLIFEELLHKGGVGLGCIVRALIQGGCVLGLLR